jgi:hypothetical protein
VEDKNNGSKAQMTKEDIEELSAFLGEGSIDKAFKNQDTLNAIRMIILQDPELMDNSMRYKIPSKRFAVAAASYVRKCEEHHYQPGIDQVKMMLGLMTSVGGERINKLVEAIGANKNFQEGRSGGFVDKIKSLYNKNE